MRPQTALNTIAALRKAPSFTSKDARVLGVSSAALAHYVKRGELERIGHGVYRDPNAPKPAHFQWEDLVEAVQRVRDGVVCLTSALALYDLTEEIPRQHWIAIRNDTSHRAPPSTRVTRMRNVMLGRTTMKLGKITISIFDRERTIVDAFRFLGVEAAIKSLRAAAAKKGPQRIDLEKMRKYAIALRVKKIYPYLLAVTT